MSTVTDQPWGTVVGVTDEMLIAVKPSDVVPPGSSTKAPRSLRRNE